MYIEYCREGDLFVCLWCSDKLYRKNAICTTCMQNYCVGIGGVGIGGFYIYSVTYLIILSQQEKGCGEATAYKKTTPQKHRE